MDADNTRRRFLLSSALGLSSAWLALRWPAIVAAQQHAQRSGKSGQSASFEFFAPPDALEIEAVAAQIIPSDDAPGAREARVIYFIDRALMTFDVDKQLAYTQGLEDLQQKTLELFPVADGFSDFWRSGANTYKNTTIAGGTLKVGSGANVLPDHNAADNPPASATCSKRSG